MQFDDARRHSHSEPVAAARLRALRPLGDDPFEFQIFGGAFSQDDHGTDVVLGGCFGGDGVEERVVFVRDYHAMTSGVAERLKRPQLLCFSLLR